MLRKQMTKKGFYAALGVDKFLSSLNKEAFSILKRLLCLLYCKK